MTDPRYRPRDFAVSPDLFGRADSGWNPLGSDESEAAQRAAKMQHRYAVQIRARMKARGFTLKAYATAAGSSYDRIAKMLRGEVIMRLEDIAIADMILDEVSEYERGAAKRRERDAAARR